MLLNKIANFSLQKVFILNEIAKFSSPKFFRYVVVLKYTYVYVVKPPSFFKTDALNSYQTVHTSKLPLPNTSNQVCLFCTLA